MNLKNGHVNLIRRYLLGELSEQEQDQVEQLLMSDDNFHKELLVAEDDLIDDYIFEALPEEDRTKFKRRFLQVPELRRNVIFTAALRKHALETAPPIVAEEPAPPRLLFGSLRKFFMQPAVAVSFAGVLLLAIPLGGWLVKQNSQLRRRVEQLEARQVVPPGAELQERLEAARLRNEQLEAEVLRQQQLLAEESRKLQLAQEQQRTPASGTEMGSGAVLALTLTSGYVRDSGEWTKFSVPREKRQVRFQLDLAANDYQSYKAVLKTVEGKYKWSRAGLKVTAEKIVPFEVPSRILAADDYQIILSGVNSSGASSEISSYYFRVVE